MTAKYDSIGINYAELRKPDPRIAAEIQAALGQAELNVGAGTGSYEPVAYGLGRLGSAGSRAHTSRNFRISQDKRSPEPWPSALRPECRSMTAV
jgi:hypothetical protein